MSLVINVHGGTACVATEYGTSPVGATCNLPLNKIVWGDDSVSYKVNEAYPLPVQIMEVTGESLVVAGSLGQSGDFTFQNKVHGVTAVEFIAVAGSTNGTTPVGISGNVAVTNSITVGNTLTIRPLSSATDTVTVTGNVGITGGLSIQASTDSVSVYGYDGGRYVNTVMYGADGTTIGNSGDAINVNLVNAGATLSLNIGATVGVVNGDSGIVVVGGPTGSAPIAVKGRNGEAVEVVNSPGSAVGVTGSFFTDGTQSTSISEITRPSSIVSGYTLAAVSSTQLPSNSLKSGVTIKAGKSNTDFIYVGNSGLTGGITMNGYPLQSGESIFIECNNTNLVYVIGTTGDVRGVHYIGS